MLHMREMGLSNAEIADKIGCSHMTVIRHIGKAPFVKPGRGRKKKESDTLGLPPVGNKPIPEMPHKSFAQRLEGSYKKPVSVGTVKVPEEVREDIERKLENGVITQQPLRIPADEKPCTLADLAREAHERKMAELKAVGTEDRTHIHELIAMFDPDAVTAWLKVSLYNMGIPDCRPMNRQKMLEMLKIMNAGGANA
jgi:hypothetical protein